MPSKFNESETKKRWALALQMRDKIFTDEKTGKTYRYPRQWIKKITGIMRWQAIHLGIFPNAEQVKQLRKAQDAHLKKVSDAKREARGKQAFAYAPTFKQNQRMRPQARG